MSRLLLISCIIALAICAQAQTHEGHGKCGENKVASTCANACNGSCEFPNPGACMINPQFCKEGCKCKKGYVKENRDSDKCIALEECPEPQKETHHYTPKH